ncbi:putative lipoprotein [Caldalkalibacillus thermarum TA2.A1]|uniref:Cell wall-binding repeat-containing protein n=1 Tax=Caldalkalibacillus thermarum (strain TA2.A1) TaxID=986075 RepID=F5L2Y2_CALTT|nr:hypothetical protein [Caldalkalibacillus thermarum]EGL84304.1 putative lipoprotein [Caldalkalibacillus thermarum TA2.A1]QZT35137.1 cell wall-binding repeat-containing protein [Caldalkalibacillus thermarum TA2.A1]
MDDVHDMEKDSEQGEATLDRERFAKAPTSFNDRAEENLLQTDTKNVTRINTDDPVEMSVRVSQVIWPSTHELQPGSVILIPLENWQVALASVNLIHHPNDGPVLYTVKGDIHEAVLNEINRLQPKGNEEGTQVIIMGDSNDGSKQKLEDAGWQVEQLPAKDAATFAADVDALYAEVSGEWADAVIIASMEDEHQGFSLPAANWIAHMPEPLLYVAEDGVPEATKSALEKRDGEVKMYVMGPETVISESVVEELSQYGDVIRIEGEDPTSLSVAFAQYKDEDNGFGWGITDAGHGVAFVSTRTPELAIATAPFAHLGKHAPLILLEEGEMTEPVYDFLAQIRPVFENDPTTGPYNHAYLVGTRDNISFQTQGIIDEKLEITQMGEGHGGH